MKRLLLLLLAGFSSLLAQNAQCQFTLSFTVAGSQSPAYSNRPTTTDGGPGCVNWRVVYWTNASSSTSIQIEGAADSGGAPTGSYTALTPASGGGSGSGSTTNPATGQKEGQILACCDYYPWIRITVNTLTSSGAGTVLQVKVLGYVGTSAGNGGGGGGGGGITQLTQDVLAGPGSGSQAATVVGIDTVPLCSGYAPSNGQVIQYTTGGMPNPCYTASTISASGGLVLVEEHTAANSASLDFTTCISATYDEYQVEFLQLLPVSDTNDFWLRFSNDGGATYDATGGHYGTGIAFWISATTGATGSTSDTKILLSQGASQISSNATYGGWSGTFKIFNPASTNYVRVNGQSNSADSAGVGFDLGTVNAGSYRGGAAANAFQVLAASGNISSGTVRCYGLAK